VRAARDNDFADLIDREAAIVGAAAAACAHDQA
jgi:hypothetical protein